MQSDGIVFEQIAFDDVPGWRADDHLAAWAAFLNSCALILKDQTYGAPARATAVGKHLADVCRAALGATAGAAQTRDGARHFFEGNFRPHKIIGGSTPGLLTGYYEPLVRGSRTATGDFVVPIYRRPHDLINMVAESERGATSAAFTHLRKTANGLVPHLTRAQIESGGLSGQGLELLYLADPIDVFFMQVQGSGQVELQNGERVRVTYDGKNGYPYTSIGRVLIDRGDVRAEGMSMEVLRAWLEEDRERARQLLWKNESYVFFRELEGDEGRGPLGVNGIPLSTGRSLAVDTRYHVLGSPIYVDAPNLTHGGHASGFRRLMIAQDVGSAIRGPERGDIYFGSGDDAGRIAGITKHEGRFIVLLPVGSGVSPNATGQPS